jgi:hypothetical protein
MHTVNSAIHCNIDTSVKFDDLVAAIIYGMLRYNFCKMILNKKSW